MWGRKLYKHNRKSGILTATRRRARGTAKTDKRLKRLRVRRQEAVRRRRTLLCAAVIIVLVTLGAISHLDIFAIRKIEVYGDISFSKIKAETFAADFLKGTRALIFSRSNRFIYPRSSLSKALLTAFPQLMGAAVSERAGVLSIELFERLPSALWCEGKSQNETNGCYFIDSSGFIFTKAPRVSEQAYFIYRGGMINASSSPIGMHPFSAEELVKFKEFLAGIHEQGFFPVSLTASSSDIYINTKGGMQIYAPRVLDTEQTLANLRAALTTEEFAGKGNLEDMLEYIDLRFGNRIYYK